MNELRKIAQKELRYELEAKVIKVFKGLENDLKLEEKMVEQAKNRVKNRKAVIKECEALSLEEVVAKYGECF